MLGTLIAVLLMAVMTWIVFRAVLGWRSVRTVRPAWRWRDGLGGFWRGGRLVPNLAYANVVMGPVRRVRLDPASLPPAHRLRWGPPIVVPRSTQPLWREKGWQRRGNVYQGEFRANGRSWRGQIEVPYPGGYCAYIWHPPMAELANHPHRFCFRDRRLDGRYQVHFARTPQSVDHAITGIEQVLLEAITGRW